MNKKFKKGDMVVFKAVEGYEKDDTAYMIHSGPYKVKGDWEYNVEIGGTLKIAFASQIEAAPKANMLVAVHVPAGKKLDELMKFLKDNGFDYEHPEQIKDEE